MCIYKSYIYIYTYSIYTQKKKMFLSITQSKNRDIFQVSSHFTSTSKHPSVSSGAWKLGVAGDRFRFPSGVATSGSATKGSTTNGSATWPMHQPVANVQKVQLKSSVHLQEQEKIVCYVVDYNYIQLLSYIVYCNILYILHHSKGNTCRNAEWVVNKSSCLCGLRMLRSWPRRERKASQA